MKKLVLVLCAAALCFGQRPGDEQPIGRINPAYQLQNIRPNAMNFPIGGMDFMSDGRLVVTSWRDPYGVYFISNVLSGNPGQMSLSLFANGLREMLGVKVVNDSIYVLQKEELTLLLDHDNDGTADEYRAIAYDWTKSVNEKEYAQGLIYDGTYFYAAFGGSTVNGGTNVDPSPAGRQNGVLRISKDGTVEPFSGGMRVPGGIGYAYGEIWVTENQGGFRVSNPLINIREGRWYGRLVNPPTVFQTAPYANGALQASYSPFAVRLPYLDLGRSPGTPLVVNDGIFKGQMFIAECDGAYGGIIRAFLEVVNGEYQGAAFRFSQGFSDETVFDMLWGPDGNLYAGANGSDAAGWDRNTHVGLDRLVPTGQSAFEMLAIRSMGPAEFQIEFTKPIATSLGGDVRNLLEMRKWWYQIGSAYGGSKQNDQALTVNSAAVSQDRLFVTVNVSGLQEGWDHYFHWTNDAMETSSGEKLWGTEAWYSLHNFGPGQNVPINSGPQTKAQTLPFTLTRLPQLGIVIDLQIAKGASFILHITDVRGAVHVNQRGTGNQKLHIGNEDLPSGVYLITLRSQGKRYTQLGYR